MKIWLNFALVGAFLALGILPAQAQCEKWIDNPRGEEAEDAHVLYRQYIKAEEFETAFPFWQTAYSIAPAADGQRPSHYVDGRTLYLHMFKNETDEAKKKEYAETILRLYDEEIACYGNEGFLLGRKAYDMFYYLRSPYAEVVKALDGSIEKSGNNVEYIVFDPYARIIVSDFQKERMDAAKARELNLMLNELADYNIANNASLSAYYQQAKDAMNSVFSAIEGDIFDCAYFKAKFEPLYRENAEDYESIKYYYSKLVNQGCDAEDPFVMELKTTYEKLAAEINAQMQAEFFAKNPGAHAKHLYDEGQYNDAINKYDEAIEKEKAGEAPDQEQIATYHFAVASILFRKLNRYNDARERARSASKLRPNWGQPYMLIGDMYASSSSSCGADAWDHQLAVLAAIDKYAQAKNADSEVAEEASRKIGQYSGFKPDKEVGFMKGVQAGQQVRVPCWIGETVTVRY